MRQSKLLVTFLLISILFVQTAFAQNINVNTIGKNNTYNISNTYNIYSNSEIHDDLFINEEISTGALMPRDGQDVENGYYGDIVYYCNIKLKSALEIDEKAKYMALGITYNFTNTLDKAKELFKFVTSYLKYDYTKYDQIKKRTNLCDMKAGAQQGFNTRSGVCFEFATLYAAMAHASNLKVRLVYGEAHIWNQVLDPKMNKWISIDCTWNLYDFDVNAYHENYVTHAEF